MPEPLLELRADDPARIEAARELARGAIAIADTPGGKSPLIIERIGLPMVQTSLTS